MRRVADDLGGFVGGEGIWKIPKSPLHVLPERAPALVRNGNEAFPNIHGIHLAIIIDHHPLLGRLGVEDAHGGANPSASAKKPKSNFMFYLGFSFYQDKYSIQFK